MIQVGQVLDKYELLERVGQGGMAVVYRGLDRTLKRVVAVKILHKHLADSQEARDRFEREAQAVAKLRHENILEIFDFSAKADADSYIVTEFIDGQTLRQVISERPIAFPEIGAMLVLQVGRALAHAHAAGILHRDIKPENIMIRSDGVVKLMDFGISHMVDLERLTVTGQLLGSPAYMSPEHVEGRPLDFRTDVFAAGIVLYQLCVGRLPFEGKNPHEVLKRIAECKFVDPRQANPRIGNRLGRIILRAMAAQPADRFAAIGEMVVALEQYLDESGLPHDKIAGELARYFAAPAAYEQALEDRLIDHLTRTGQQLLAQDSRAAALDVFDRVLTIDADNEKVIAILDGINRRLRLRAIGLGVLAAAVIGGGAYMIHHKARPPGLAMPLPGDPGEELVPRASFAVATEDPPPPVVADAQRADDEAGEPGATRGASVRPSLRRAVDAGVPPPATPPLRVSVFPVHGSEVAIGDGGWRAVARDGSVTQAITGPVTIRARNTCCEPKEVQVEAGQTEVALVLPFRAGHVIARCDLPGAIYVRVDDRPATLGHKAPVFFKEGSTLGVENVRIEFTTAQRNWTQTKQVPAGETIEVRCEPPP